MNIFIIILGAGDFFLSRMTNGDQAENAVIVRNRNDIL